MADTSPSQEGDSSHTAITQPSEYRRPDTPTEPSSTGHGPLPGLRETRRESAGTYLLPVTDPDASRTGPVADRNPGECLPVGSEHERRTEPSTPTATSPPCASNTPSQPDSPQLTRITGRKHPDLRPAAQGMAHRRPPAATVLAAGGQPEVNTSALARPGRRLPHGRVGGTRHTRPTADRAPLHPPAARPDSGG